MKNTWLTKRRRAITLTLLLPLVFIFWLIGTESGLNFIYQHIKSYIPGYITIGTLQGSLVGPISVTALQYKYNGSLIIVSELTMEWLPAGLITNNLDINRLYLQSLKINLPPSEKIKPVRPVIVPKLDFPWRIALNDVVIDDFSFNQVDNNFDVKQIKLIASSKLNQVKIKSLRLMTSNVELNLNGQLNLQKNYKHKFEVSLRTKLPKNAILESRGYIEGTIKSFKILQSVRGPVQFTFKAEVHELLDKLNWQAEADIISINPEKIWPDWPAKIKGQLTSKGYTEKGQLFAELDISKLRGQLRGSPVSLMSRLQWHNNTLELNHFDLFSGKTKFSAQGKVHSNLNLNWTLTSNNLAEVYPDIQGRLSASGLINGTTSAPNSSATFNVQNIILPEYKVSSIKGNINLDIFHWQKIKVKLAAQSLKYKEYEIKSVDINSDSKNTELKILSKSATTYIKLTSEIRPQALQVRLMKAELLSPHFTTWKLKTPAALKIFNNQFLLEPFCILSTEGSVCLTLQKNNDIWQSHIEVSKFPLMVFNPFLPVDLKLEGVTDATADFSLSSQLMGYAEIKLLPGFVSYPLPGGEREKLQYRNGTVDVTLNNQEIKVSSELSINNTDYFKGQLILPNVKHSILNSYKQQLQATAQLNIKNIGLLEAFAPEVQSLKGEMGFKLAVSGTFSHPKINGNVYLNNGSLFVPRLGINIQQLNLKSESNGLEALHHVTARSGNGHINIHGKTKLNHKDSWPTSIIIKGENFEVSNIPVSYLVVSPDLQLNLQKYNVKINGDINIPYAKLNPKDLTTAERLSDDVVIIDSKAIKKEKWHIYTKVRLSLGERILFSGFGFNGRFAGSILLQDDPEQLTKATGEIKIPEGRYIAYGQNLRVENGKLLFTGGPVTNPGLDLRAIRKIDTVTAGLKVTGNLKEPKIELFSIPAMGQTDILSYLLLGRPIENATGDEGEMMAKAALTLSLIGGDRIARTLGERYGFDEMRVESSNSGEQASLVIGRYLSPRLYIGYGIGLIESYNTFNVRYKISEKWQIKGESGENQGADILYTIER